MPHFNSIFGMNIDTSNIQDIVYRQEKKIPNLTKITIDLHERRAQPENERYFADIWIIVGLWSDWLSHLHSYLKRCSYLPHPFHSSKTFSMHSQYEMRVVFPSLFDGLHKRRNLFINRWQTAHFVSVLLAAYCDIGNAGLAMFGHVAVWAVT